MIDGRKKNKKIVFLVTGGAGFIGSNICEELLKRGYIVRCLDNFSRGKKENIAHLMEYDDFELLIGDIIEYSICDKSAMGVDYIIHQAALDSVSRRMKESLIYEEANIKGTINIFEAAKNNKVKRVVFASDSSVYGDSDETHKREGNEGKSLSPYSITKKVAEEYGLLYTRLYGLETIALRYFNVYGRKQKVSGYNLEAIPRFMRSIFNNGNPKIEEEWMESRDFTYVDDVVEANIRACFAPKEAVGQVFNIASGESKRIIDVCNKIAVMLNKETRYYHSEIKSRNKKSSSVDISKAQKLLGYRPEYNFDDGLELTIEWYIDKFNS